MISASTRRARATTLATLLSVGALGCSKPEAAREVASEPRADAIAIPALAAAASAAKGPDGVLFAKKMPAVGAKRQQIEDSAMTMDVSIDLGNGKREVSSMRMTGSETRVEEVLAMTGDAPAKLKVTYAEKSETSGKAGQERPKTSPLAGKTYLVDATGGALTITDEKGKTAPAAESREIEKHFQRLGKPDPVLLAMPTTPLKPGDPVPALAKAVEQDVTNTADGMAVSNTIVVFKEMQGDEGVFDVRFTLTREQFPMTIKVDMTGPMKVSRTTGQRSSLTLRGRLRVSAKDDPRGAVRIKLDGTGDMTMNHVTKSL